MFILFGPPIHYSYLYSHERDRVAKRRGNGEGSVYRRKDGLWVVTLVGPRRVYAVP